MKRACAAVLALVAVLVVGLPAQAQLPPTPQVPQVPLPEPVPSTVIQVIDTAVPIVGQTAIALRPAVIPVGFALRAPCAGLGAAGFVLALGSSVVVTPFPTGVLIGPALILCSGAFEPGPADPVLQQLDDATGDMVEEQTDPVLEQLSGAADPAKPQLDEGCGVIKIFAEAPRQAPPPVHRIDAIGVLCE
ncbi:MAG TPA: hypothetical protein VFA34_04115 [Actinomycetota bacterium]|nr:hypothetical protein [Actinomycetota bacterium]